MMKFYAGIVIAVFSIIVGMYQYVEDRQIIKAREAALDRALTKKRSLQNVQNQISEIPKNALVRGDDKKNHIEKLLNIGRPGLSFDFTGQSNRSSQSDVLFRHNFKVTGFATYEEFSKTLRDLGKLTGFVVVSSCYGCIKPQKGTKVASNQHSVTIEGYLYVHDPHLI